MGFAMFMAEWIALTAIIFAVLVSIAVLLEP